MYAAAGYVRIVLSSASLNSIHQIPRKTIEPRRIHLKSSSTGHDDFDGTSQDYQVKPK